MAVGSDNWCHYEYNPSELYQNPGHGNVCGRETFQGSEDYEDVTKDSSGNVQIQTKTRLRDAYDPFCPEHGGTKDPRGNSESSTSSTSSSSESSSFISPKSTDATSKSGV